MMPANLRVLNDRTTVLSLSGLTIDQWVNRYVETGQAARDYDYLLEAQRKAWISDMQALDAPQFTLDETASSFWQRRR